MAESNPSQFKNLQGMGKKKEQEPLLNSHYIVDAFHSFGFEPTRADMHYWTTIKESQKGQLVKELKDRKDGSEEKVNAQHEQMASRSKTPGHLSDEQIYSIYSEYGFPKPDVHWVREHLPDDEEKLKSVLDIQRKHMDAMIKIQSKGILDNVKNQMQGQQQPPMPMPGGGPGYSNDGQGGPNDPSFSKYTPHFVGDYSIIKFTPSSYGAGAENSPSTVWLIDNKNKVLRPFLSQDSFDNMFTNPKEAEKSIVTISSSDLNDSLKGFELLSSSYGIQKNGTYKSLPADRATLAQRYGKAIDEDSASTTVAILDTFIDTLRNDPNKPISNSFLDSIKTDKLTMAKYINALCYGDYSLTDVYKDLKKNELIKAGDKSLEGVEVIDQGLNKKEYASTSAAKLAAVQPKLSPPANIGDFDISDLNYSIFKIPDKAFKKLTPTLDVNSEQFKKDMEGIQGAYYDILTQQAQATTGSEKAIADENWSNFKEQLEASYGLKLSNNAVAAWGQLQQLAQQFSDRGISGSGIEASDVDTYLRQVRNSNMTIRQQQITQEESKEADYYRASGSPDQIAKLNAEDQAKGLPRDQWRTTRWGLSPSQEMLDSLNINTLKQKYPNETEADLQNMINKIIDPSGNFRSTLYQKQFDAVDTARAAKEEFQRSTLLKQNQQADKEQMNEFTDPVTEPGGSAFSKFTAPGDTEGLTPQKTTSTDTTGATDSTKLTVGQQSQGYTSVAATYYDPKTNKRIAVDPTGVVKSSVKTIPAGYVLETKAPVVPVKTTPTIPVKSTTPVTPAPTKPIVVPKNLTSSSVPVTPVTPVTPVPTITKPVAPAPSVAATYYDPKTNKRIAVDPTGTVKGSVKTIPTGYVFESKPPKL